MNFKHFFETIAAIKVNRHLSATKKPSVSVVLAITVSHGLSGSVERINGKNFQISTQQEYLGSPLTGVWDICCEVALCRRCKGLVAQEKLVSKGKGHKTQICRYCDNKRRRSNYRKKTVPAGETNFVVRLEATDHSNLASISGLVLDILQDQQLLELPNQRVEIDVLSLLRQQSKVDLTE